MSSVLYDVPGPKAILRNRILAVVTVVVVLAILGFIIYRLAVTGQFTAEKWRIFTFPLVHQNIIDATLRTLSAFAVAAVASLVLGLLLSIGRLSDHAIIRVPVMLFTELFRAIPVLILMMIMYYGLPPLGVTFMTPFLAVVIGLTLYNGSVLAEVFRAGIESLPKGQTEAGYAIGMRKSAVMLLIQYPQAIRAMMPVIISQLVVVLKDTALGFIVTFQELLYLAKFYGGQVTYGSPIIPSTIVFGTIYILLCLALSAVAKWVEVRSRRNPRITKVAPAVQAANQVEIK
ncbi:amino acid ABC transporter permease [Salinibacterium sp. dk2585]|uniref:amino acid ABC transporter permease n=1 Tax=unclassified Salinibacterium TaxID=2632331 RepID=UPI0011C257C1|nr:MULTISPECIES: amino acid ABC transporter permease [unclassified Salinibacterium]QEE61636.1 amino acid ABC transporter permease [Salinibacterium sp. dk2585]TXK54812.1 amino acid ABC transporter permease [Salinibacterium sp. dk5596]